MPAASVTKSMKPLEGAFSFPGDKSISHRAIICGALAEGVSTFTNVLTGEDCVCTRKAFEILGVKTRVFSETGLEIQGQGLAGLVAPSKELYLGNSGTAMRLLLGLLAACPFRSVLTGDESLSSRPMRRVTDFLVKMGARVEGRDGGNFAPLAIHGGKLKSIDAVLPVASAQVKSALLLAGLYAEGTTRVTEPEKSRDHTERFLTHFGVALEIKGTTVSIRGGQRLTPQSFKIAGDISSAAFFMAMSLLVPASRIHFESVLWNPTRTGMVDVLKRMGLRLETLRVRSEGPELVADFDIAHQTLRSFEIHKNELPSLIDEIPILTVLATQASGRSVIHEAHELRVKETDRIHSMVETLSRMGASIRAEGDSLVIDGPTALRGATLPSFHDHRTAMSLLVAGLVAEGQTTVQDIDCIRTSFPSFFELVRKAGASCLIQ